MRTTTKVTGVIAAIAMLGGCATPDYQKPAAEAPAPPAAQRQAQAQLAAPVDSAKILKRKIAIGRFSNETRYGRTFVRSDTGDPLGKQTSDMLAARLVESGSFLVFERPDLDKLIKEQKYSGAGDIIGVDTLILGAVTEFGRSTVTRGGLLSSTKMQKVEAKVEIRLADPRNGHVFFSASGRGESSSEAGEVFGFGSQADYDASLNDKAIGAAISDVMNGLVTKLKEKPWRTDILKVEGSRLYISGGVRQGLRPGDLLGVMRPGERIKSGQTGFTVALPSAEIATIKVVEDDGMSDADMVHAADPAHLGGLFGADTVLYITIEKWAAQYIVLDTVVQVDVSYILKETGTGQTIWEHRQVAQYNASPGDGGGGIAGLVIKAVAAAIAKAKPDYIRLARQANGAAFGTPQQGLPPGPHYRESAPQGAVGP